MFTATKVPLLVCLFALFFTQSAVSQEADTTQGDKTPVTDRQLSVMMFVDYGRSYGYQSMLAQIQIDTIKAELERDRQIAAQLEKLLTKDAISQTEFEIAQLKVIWGEKQLKVAEKNLIAIGSQFEAMKKMAKHFAGVEVPRDELYEVFRKGWEAGCDKGPDEVDAMKAWVDFCEKSLQRSRALNQQGSESLTSVLEKEAQLKIAEANYRSRKSRLDMCREILFPSLGDIKSIKR
ncbi:MAG: hypothetical protein MUC83_13015 [Pirellula sp.]|jgi:hypothetical protein|nr:hypothetical protein [Pirellula sp.]